MKSAGFTLRHQDAVCSGTGKNGGIGSRGFRRPLMKMPGAGPRSGFTFLEVLVSLAVVAIMASVLFISHIGLITADARARAIEESSIVALRIAAESWLGNSVPTELSDLSESWDVDRDYSVSGGEGDPVTWETWSIAPVGRPQWVTVLSLRRNPSSPLR